MAIHIYLCDTSAIKDRYVEWNDEWFELFVYKKKEMTSQCIKMMETIDGAIYQQDDKFLSKFNRAVVDTIMLSTGCKTAINCVLFPDKVFEAAETGKNALIQILQLEEASLHFSIWLTPLFVDIKNEFILHTSSDMDGRRFDSYMDLYEKAREC